MFALHILKLCLAQAHEDINDDGRCRNSCSFLPLILRKCESRRMKRIIEYFKFIHPRVKKNIILRQECYLNEA